MIVVDVEPDAVAPRVRIETTASGIVRVNADGSGTNVRGSAEDGVLYDYECPQESPVYYATDIDPAARNYDESDLVEMPDVGLWLVHPGTPSLSRRLTLNTHDGWLIPSGSSTVSIPGGDTIAVTFPRGSESGVLRVKLWGRDDFDDFRALIADGQVLFLSAPYDYGIGSGHVLLGDVAADRVGQHTGSQMRFASFPFQFVRRPEVITLATVTIDSLTGTIDSLTGTIDSLGA